MENTEAYLKNHKKARYDRKKILSVLMVMSVIVAIIVFWWLKLTGITITGEAFCEKNEHIHDAECYDYSLICTEEDETHEHTEECFEKTLSCTLEEHTHVLSCYSDMEADKETAEDWESTFDNSNLTESPKANLVYIAETQTGYSESEINYKADENGNKQGYSRYGEWYGNPYGDWSGMFLSFCLEYAGINEANEFKNAGVEAIKNSFERKEIYKEAAFHTPEAGEIVFLDTDSDGSADICGVVKEVADGEITAILGDSENSVKETVLDNAALVSGYGLTDSFTVTLPESGKTTDVEETTQNGEEEETYETTERVTETTTEEITTEENKVGFDDLYPENKEKVQNVINLINALPNYENIMAKVAEFQMEDDADGEAEYVNTVAVNIRTAYVYYQELEELQQYVSNSEKLLDVNMKIAEPYFQSQSLAISNAITVYQINTYTVGAHFVCYGGNTQRFDPTMAFTYWDVYFFEYIEGSTYRCYNSIKEDVVKNNHTPATNGFLLYIYNDPTANGLAVGDYVTINFTLSTKAYNASGVGKVSPGSEPVDATENTTDNTNKLTIVPSVSTRDIIDINLFNYGTGINTYYTNTNHVQPGFQQDGGSASAAWNKFGMNFGNNITEDRATLIIDVTTNNAGEINKTYDTANSSVGTMANYQSGGSYPLVMSPVMQNGYPAMINGTSLNWLFSDDSTATVVKKNSQNIDGLFQKNDETGEYFFNSRDNHAQFNSSDDTFTLYKQIITPNFIMYPFGNFLPFNDIVHTATQSSTINASYFTKVANRSSARASAGWTLAGVTTHYSNLSTALNQYVSLMNSSKGTGWTSLQAINAYFSVAGLPTFTGPPEFEGATGSAATQKYLENMYNIDYDEKKNFFFGMDIHTILMQPKGGMTGTDNAYPMEFKFTGDDDVWVYLDDVLFLDLSGIHRHVGGKISFVEGKVYYYNLIPADGDVNLAEPLFTKTFSEILTEAGRSDLAATLNSNGTFSDYTSHKFDFYYMERGAGSGICRINFNFPMLQKNTIEVAKEVSSRTPVMLGNPYFTYQLLRANPDGTKTNELLIGPGVEYEIRDIDTNELIKTQVTDDEGCFRLRAGHKAVFKNVSENEGKYYVRELLDQSVYTQYGQVKVDGVVIATHSDHDQMVDVDNFKGFESVVKDASEKSTVFAYNNDIEPNKLGSLSINKKVSALSEFPIKETFSFDVTLDETPIPVGTPYIRYKNYQDDGSYSEAINETFTEEGKITLAKDDMIVIENILAGSTYRVVENPITEGYSVTYDPSTSEDSATGVIRVGGETGQTTLVTVTNNEEGTSTAIYFRKELLNGDSIARDFSFKITEVTDITGETDVENGITGTHTLSVSNRATDRFLLGFTADQLGSASSVTYYFKVEEIIPENPNPNIEYSNVAYVVEILVRKLSDSLDVLCMGVYVNGERTDQEDVLDISPLIFTNTLNRSIWLRKNIQVAENKEVDENVTFDFQIKLYDVNGNPLSGTYQKVVTSSKTEADTVNDITFTNGEALVQLGNGETLTLNKIPAGTTWEINEVGADGWNPFIKYDESGALNAGNTASGDTDSNNHVIFVNMLGFELPETGGRGTLIYTICGFILMLIPLLYCIVFRRKERRVL